MLTSKLICLLMILNLTSFLEEAIFLKKAKTNFVLSSYPPSIYDIHLKDIKAEDFTLGQFQGKKILLVNVASNCGYTKQYNELQELHELYKEKLVIIGLPCNQFFGQEPKNEEEIARFCEKNYGITFILTQKIKVKGKNKHPLYKWLTDKELNGQFDSSVKWNFQKYLIDESGKLIKVFYSETTPMSKELTDLI